MRRLLDKCLLSTGYRLYKKTHIGNGINRKRISILISWMDKRCSKCGKYMKKTVGYGSICEHCNVYRSTYDYVRRNINKLKVGYIW